jgi:hypothetical protein
VIPVAHQEGAVTCSMHSGQEAAQAHPLTLVPRLLVVICLLWLDA